METESVERLWQAVMNVAVAMKKDGIDTGDAARRLRDAKVLLNHCIYDEHAHGEELFEAEIEIEKIQGYLVQILEKEGKSGKYSFDLPNLPAKGVKKDTAAPANVFKDMPKGKNWFRIKIVKGMDVEKILNLKDVTVIEQTDDSITLSGDRDAISHAVKEISKVFRE